ncbi:response regulator transcription factor [Rhodothermus marinus]|uniref:response regulator transcription factor n=1 Tax=Rhodothermus marinus TaxID=29549 RepID=UPI001D21D8EE|nr:response regulator transcription factor [Rhodothermus marinus]MBO2491578.1 response regulator transcription factor [Rhodothermus marinus]
MSARILIVEDDAPLRALLQERLAAEGYTVEAVATGEEALQALEARPPDLVVLDLMLPGMDGLEVCRRLRARHPAVYVLMLTARSSELDRVVGLEVGADDYVTKPFSLNELVARVRAGLRRLQLDRETAEEAPLEFDGLRIDPVRRQVWRDGQPVHLTVREFELLLFLARHPDRPFTRLQLLQEVWGIDYPGYARTVDSHIQRLRAKIEPTPGTPRYIRTVWGVGYKFQSSEEP